MLRASTASPAYADVYAALIAVVNTKLPEVGDLLLTRAVLQFRSAYARRDRAVATATATLLAHMFNQGMVHELTGLQLLTLLLDGDPTNDSVEVAAAYLTAAGRALLEASPAGVRAVMDRLRSLLHDGTLGPRVQHRVEKLMKARRGGFEGFPSVPPELDLVERDDQVVLEVGLDDEGLRAEKELDRFRYDPDFDPAAAHLAGRRRGSWLSTKK